MSAHAKTPILVWMALCLVTRVAQIRVAGIIGQLAAELAERILTKLAK
jgi:hypothetical protein